MLQAEEVRAAGSVALSDVAERDIERGLVHDGDEAAVGRHGIFRGRFANYPRRHRRLDMPRRGRETHHARARPDVRWLCRSGRCCSPRLRVAATSQRQRVPVSLHRAMLCLTSEIAPLVGPCLTKNDSQLPTAAWLSVERCVLIATSGTISNQRLEYTREPRGEPFDSDALGGDAGTLEYQEDFVRKTLGIAEPGITAQADKPFAGRGLVVADDAPRRMVLVRQFDRSIGECTAALGLVLLEITEMAQPGQ